MDPLTPATNNQTDDQQNAQPGQPQQPQPQQVSAGGFSPEVVSAPVSNQESGASKEAGYENIQQIERKAEEIEHKEVSRPTPQPQPQEQKSEPKPESPEKKEPKGPKFKYFGYKPPQALMANLSRLRTQAYRGSAKDSRTWLLFFLDRLAKKEDK